MTKKELGDIQFLKEGMLKAGEIAMDYWQKGVKAEIKTANYDVTTEADRAVEEYLTSWIKKHFPNTGVMSEELGGKVSSEFFTIDGIDGSSFFASGLPEWAISLTRIKSGEVVTGIVYAPTLDELYYAKRGFGAYLNDQRIYVSKEDNFQNAIVNIGQDTVRVYSRSDIEERFIKASRAHYAIASSALAYGSLAAGRVHVAIHMNQPVWDIAPGIILVEEAGGKFTDWDNTRDLSLVREQANNIVASNGILHEQAIALLNR